MLRLKNFHLSEDERAFRKVLSIFLEKIATSSVKCASVEHQIFREEMRQLREHAENEISPALLLVAAGCAAQAMEAYNQRIKELLAEQTNELQSIVSIVSEIALTIGGADSRALERLQEAGQRIEIAGVLQDLKGFRAALSDCMGSFKTETARQKAESDGTIRALQLEIERRPSETNTASDRYDPVTGLLRQSAGLLAMHAALQSNKRLYVLVMVVNGIEGVNSRFGFAYGDRMLRVFKENIETRLLGTDRLFRWDGPAIVALMDRAEPVPQVRGTIRRILEQTFHMDGRSVLTPITADWTAFPLVPPLDLAAKQIQSFIARAPSII